MAAELYRAYGADSGWRNFQGNPMPEWLELPTAIRDHWVAAARAAERVYAHARVD